jgi:hypothetical protein
MLAATPTKRHYSNPDPAINSSGPIKPNITPAFSDMKQNVACITFSA